MTFTVSTYQKEGVRHKTLIKDCYILDNADALYDRRQKKKVNVSESGHVHSSSECTVYCCIKCIHTEPWLAESTEFIDHPENSLPIRGEALTLYYRHWLIQTRISEEAPCNWVNLVKIEKKKKKPLFRVMCCSFAGNNPEPESESPVWNQ